MIIRGGYSECEGRNATDFSNPETKLWLFGTVGLPIWGRQSLRFDDFVHPRPEEPVKLSDYPQNDQNPTSLEVGVLESYVHET